MPTTSIIAMAHPTDTDTSLVSVYYDGDDVGDTLRQLIARDGYPTVYAALTQQASRNWRELAPHTTDHLPDGDRFPAGSEQAVAGYGALFLGEHHIAAAEIDTWDPDTARDRQYRVRVDGTVDTIR